MADALKRLIDAIVCDDRAAWTAALVASPHLAVACAAAGADRSTPSPYFYASIRHYLYEGDTPLHMAAAAGNLAATERLIQMGAAVSAGNRRGAVPLHYATDGGPDTPGAAAVQAIVAALVAAGADPNARDKSGGAPLHRAVRNRSFAAVEALLDAGADLSLRNGSGSTPLSLAMVNSGKSGSGSPAARAAREDILRLLEARGAT